MSRATLALGLLAVFGCRRDDASVASFDVAIDRNTGAISIAHDSLGEPLDDLYLTAGTGDADVEMSFGSFQFTNITQDLSRGTRMGPVRGQLDARLIEVEGPDGPLGNLGIYAVHEQILILEWQPLTGNRAGFDAPCVPDDHFLGLGGHAFDIDHVGEAFGLWVSEPGIGKSDEEAYPADWYLVGTRHSTSYPTPYLMRPHRNEAILAYTGDRVDVDLCATDPDRFSVTAWQEGTLRIVYTVGTDPLDLLDMLTLYTGRYDLPQPWVFAPWNDAVRGTERVQEVASRLRAFNAPSSVIWTEDWKGATQTEFGYHLTGEWEVDETLYPDAAGTAAELEEQGFKWFAYFSPFLVEETRAWDEALEAGVMIRTAAGDPYTFTNPTFETATMVDLVADEGRDWAVAKMKKALEIGFDGWMADYAEWLPTDALVGYDLPGLHVHNAFPEYWQSANLQAVAGADASFFVRSGWIHTSGLAPVVWGGDQRTSFDADDGLPSLLPMALGLSASGAPVFTHDVAGYQSVGNPPSDKELWFRWAELGAFSPILRTHHGAFDTDNWQFDSDDETTEHWAKYAQIHTLLFPYRYGLAALAAKRGTPMILPTSFVFPGEPWDRADVWMLGSALLVAPVVEQGATGRQVDLPAGVTWYDWWTHSKVQSGYFDAPVDMIPVFAASGTTVPTFAQVPQTLIEEDQPEVIGLTDVDGARVVYLFGGGGPFSEADGTQYTPSGTPTQGATVTQTLKSGTVEVGGVKVQVTGPIEREYTFVVVN